MAKLTIVGGTEHEAGKDAGDVTKETPDKNPFETDFGFDAGLGFLYVASGGAWQDRSSLLRSLHLKSAVYSGHNLTEHGLVLDDPEKEHAQLSVAMLGPQSGSDEAYMWWTAAEKRTDSDVDLVLKRMFERVKSLNSVETESNWTDDNHDNRTEIPLIHVSANNAIEAALEARRNRQFFVRAHFAIGGS